MNLHDSSILYFSELNTKSLFILKIDLSSFVLCVKIQVALNSGRYIPMILLYVSFSGISGKYFGTFQNILAKMGKFAKLEKLNSRDLL